MNFTGCYIFSIYNRYNYFLSATPIGAPRRNYSIYLIYEWLLSAENLVLPVGHFIAPNESSRKIFLKDNPSLEKPSVLVGRVYT